MNDQSPYVLLIEDNPGDADLVRFRLVEGKWAVERELRQSSVETGWPSQREIAFGHPARLNLPRDCQEGRKHFARCWRKPRTCPSLSSLDRTTKRWP